MQLRDAHELHQQALRRLHRAPATLKSYRTYVGAFLRFLEERGLDTTLDSLTPELVGDAQDWLRARSMGSRDGAVAEYMLVVRLKSFARWLWRRRHAPHDPLDRLERPQLPKVHRQPFSEAEVRRLVWAAAAGPSPIMERALLLVMLDTGCRIGELVGASVSEIDLEAGAIVFRNTKNRRPRRVIFRVTAYPDGTPCADGGPCVAALRAWLAARSPQPGVTSLFLNRFGDAISWKSARRIYTGLGVSAGVANAIPHRSRHTHATEFFGELPGAELQLRDRLGHLSKEVLADYVSISDPMAQKAANVASLSAKWAL